MKKHAGHSCRTDTLQRRGKGFDRKRQAMSMAIKMNEMNPEPAFESVTKRALTDRSMQWKKMPEYKIFDSGRKYILRTMQDNAAEFQAVAQLWRNHASYLFGSPYEFVLDAETYPTIFDTGPIFMQKDWFMLVIEDEDRIIGATVMNRDHKNMAIEWSPVVIDTTCYSKSLCEIVYQFIEQSLSDTGAEYVFTLVPAFDRTMQELLKKLGFKVRGVIPGLILAWAGNDSYCRNTIVYMDKFYNGAEELAVPTNKKTLIPEAAAYIDE